MSYFFVSFGYTLELSEILMFTMHVENRPVIKENNTGVFLLLC
jgi:hypothetical protein